MPIWDLKNTIDFGQGVDRDWSLLAMEDWASPDNPSVPQLTGKHVLDDLFHLGSASVHSNWDIIRFIFNILRLTISWCWQRQSASLLCRPALRQQWTVRGIRACSLFLLHAVLYHEIHDFCYACWTHLTMTTSGSWGSETITGSLALWH